jgi:hypothetical protein
MSRFVAAVQEQIGVRECFMGIFDEEAEKMIGEAAASASREAQAKEQSAEIARVIGDDLTKYLGTHPPGYDVEIGVHEDRITARKKATGDTLEITCTGLGGFQVTIDGSNCETTNNSGMARIVIQWLQSKPHQTGV